MLKIENLSVDSNEKKIVHKISLELLPGQLSLLMGPNGSGKSTLLYALMGHPSYQISNGQVIYKNQDITDASTENRARAGIFLVSQNSPALPGVSVFTFLHQAYRALVSQDINVLDLRNRVEELCLVVGLSKSFSQRYVNDGFSGGEKKRFELLQLLLFKPKLALLDELDSGLDSDAQKQFVQILNKVMLDNPEMSILCVTHSYYISKFLKPDQVFILDKGKIVASGDAQLAINIEKVGYNALLL